MEKPNERLARYIVHVATGTKVARFEDGNAPAQVDALIHLPAGPAAMEIVAQHDSQFNSQWNALERYGHEISVPALKRHWVAQLAHTASIKVAHEELPKLIPRIEQTWPEDRLRPLTYDLPDQLSDLGIRILYPSLGIPGRISLRSAGWGGFVRDDPLAEFVEQVLADAPDVPRKLAAHPAEEKHAFIWATHGTDFSVQYALERREGQRLPQRDPRLPDGVTHVWVAGSMSSQGAFAWSPRRGWWRPEWQVPASGAMDLSNFV